MNRKENKSIVLADQRVRTRVRVGVSCVRRGKMRVQVEFCSSLYLGALCFRPIVPCGTRQTRTSQSATCASSPGISDWVNDFFPLFPLSLSLLHEDERATLPLINSLSTIEQRKHG